MILNLNMKLNFHFHNNTHTHISGVCVLSSFVVIMTHGHPDYMSTKIDTDIDVDVYVSLQSKEQIPKTL